MTLLSVARFCLSVASRARMTLWLYIGNAIDSRIRIMLMTTTISISVKPRVLALGLRTLGLQNLGLRALDQNFIYQSLYLVPSKATWSDLLKTSKTFCPPQESESLSSCIERIPHSCLVMGSTGIRRRNFSFLPATSTPVTSVSRSGGYPSLPTLIWNAPFSEASL